MSPIVNRYVTAAGALLGLALLTGTVLSAEKTSASYGRSSAHAYSDTLHASAHPGSPLILSLPDSGGATYSVLRAPALSWLIQRSFMWEAPAADARGIHTVLIERQIGGRRDTVLLVITIK